jgi:hypothetical protein
MRTPFVAYVVLAALWCGCALSARPQVERHQPSDSGSSGKLTLEEYQLHLQKLQRIVATCSARRNATACDPSQVGPDESVVAPSGLHHVRYDWLRTTLKNAASDNDVKADDTSAKKHFNENSALLQLAIQRLAEDAQPTAEIRSSNEQVRRNLNTVLAQPEFSRAQDSNELERAEAAAWRWLFDRFRGVADYGYSNPWVARLFLWSSVTLPCVLLALWVMYRLRRPHALAASAEPIETAGPSAREWQRWLQEAEAFAQEQRWREAIHHVYWAAISRMEARGMWPADRTRTPREYLVLLHRDHNLQPDLRRLTQTFERIWYGNRPAEERQYREARALMERLMPR